MKKSDLPPIIKGPLVDYAAIVDEETYYEGDEIVREGAHGSWIWVVLEGSAEIIKATPTGPFKLLRVGDGAFLGSIASLLTGNNVRGSTVMACGNIQLGMLDTQQLAGEIATLSNEYKSLIRSLDNRLRSVTDIAAQIHARNPEGLALIKDKRIAVREGQHEERLFRIREGEVVVRGVEKGYLPLAVLKEGDYFGHIPFITLGHEPHSAALFSSNDPKLATVDIDQVAGEHRRLSSTLKHMVEHLAACISATTLVTMNLYNRSGLGLRAWTGEGVSPMETREQRKHPRLNSKNLSYICLDEEDRTVKQGMGRTLNISKSGILLEIHFPVEAGHTVVVSLGLDDDLADIKGHPMCISSVAQGVYKVGWSSWRWTPIP